MKSKGLSMNSKNVTVFIGRCQPYHNAHHKIISDSLKNSRKVIVLLGSYKEPTSYHNPWTFQERYEMIKGCFSQEDFSKIVILPLRDYRYNDSYWISSVQNLVNIGICCSEKDDTVTLVGHFKDDTSYYLNFFGGWDLIKLPNYFGLNSTDIRNEIFTSVSENWYQKVPGNVTREIIKTIANNSKRFLDIGEEVKFINQYRESWSHCPYPPVFCTTDAVVVKSGHVLLVQRGINPGKGKYALPGGFLGQNENHFDSCIRELQEETKIDVPRHILVGACQNKEGKKFDHPKRDPRGRVITTAYFFDLTEKKSGLKPLPIIKGSDDASKALWMPFNDVIQNEEMFFSDHLHIIQHFITIGR